jgi:hypothetical protein
MPWSRGSLLKSPGGGESASFFPAAHQGGETRLLTATQTQHRKKQFLTSDKKVRRENKTQNLVKDRPECGFESSIFKNKFWSGSWDTVFFILEFFIWASYVLSIHVPVLPNKFLSDPETQFLFSDPETQFLFKFLNFHVGKLCIQAYKDQGCLSWIADPGSDFFPSWIPDPHHRIWVF